MRSLTGTWRGRGRDERRKCLPRSANRNAKAQCARERRSYRDAVDRCAVPEGLSGHLLAAGVVLMSLGHAQTFGSISPIGIRSSYQKSPIIVSRVVANVWGGFRPGVRLFNYQSTSRELTER